MAPFSSKNSSVLFSFNEDNMRLNDIDDFDFDNFYDGIQVIFNENGFEQWTEKMKNEFYKKLNEFACSIEYWVGGEHKNVILTKRESDLIFKRIFNLIDKSLIEQ